jgi:hypothetical protein
MFFDQNPAREGLDVVGVEDWDGALKDDYAVVQVFVHKMHSTTGDLDAVVEGLMLGFEAGKSGEKRWVDVDDSIGKGGDELGCKEAHVASQANQIDVVGMEAVDDVSVVVGAGTAF